MVSTTTWVSKQSIGHEADGLCLGSPDYREDFLYYASRLNAHNLAYLHLVDGLAFGFHKLGEPMTLAEFRKVFKNPLMGNCGYTKETAEAAIAAGHADLISFGRPFISTPDLALRFQYNLPLNEPAPYAHYYSHVPEGYITYPSATLPVGAVAAVAGN